jgi:hypothetical protein
VLVGGDLVQADQLGAGAGDGLLERLPMHETPKESLGYEDRSLVGDRLLHGDHGQHTDFPEVRNRAGWPGTTVRERPLAVSQAQNTA